MGFTVPNRSQATHLGQSRLSQADLDILTAALAGTYVLSGCAVTGNGDQTVAVASGSVRVGGTTVAVTGGNVTVNNDPSNDRYSLIVADGDGNLSCVNGTAGANPILPALPANRVALAGVYVLAGDTAIVTADVVDKRYIYLPITESHALGSHTGSLTHAATTGQTVDDHHDEAHAYDSHTGLTIPGIVEGPISTDVTQTGVTEAELIAYQVPANPAVGDTYLIKAWGWTEPTGAADVVFAVRYGGVAGTILTQLTRSIPDDTDDPFYIEVVVTVQAVGSGTSGKLAAVHTQRVDGTMNADATPAGGEGVDTTTAKDLVLTGDWSATGHTVRVTNAYIMRLA